MSLNKLQTTLAIIIINHKKKRSKAALMMILDVLKDHGQVLVVKIGVE